MRNTGVNEMNTKYYYTWQDVERAADSIVAQMCRDEWCPDYVVGITRGGLPLATILSHRLGVRMETLKIKLRDAQPDECCETNCWMADDAFGVVEDQELYKSRWDPNIRKKILIVDDINDTGATFNWLVKDWQSSCFPKEDAAWNAVWGKTTRFAVMTENLSSDFDLVSYHWDEVNKAEDPTWLVYPYE
jgi:hypoxanthine phosphoribosyltransferase